VNKFKDILFGKSKGALGHFSARAGTDGSEIVINNIDGKEVGRYPCRPDSYRESTTQKLKLPKLADGVYVARLIGKDISANSKFVVSSAGN
jgi:hypothetical protein